MKRHHIEAPDIRLRSGRKGRHAVVASAFLAAGLSCAVFITLFRSPMPVDAFAALGQQITWTGPGIAS
ncbi:MAG: hypothetical protein WBA53_09395 [Burkholderiaceae bacterium]